MSKESNIKILIACHKPSELPKNELFLPIQVGAAKAKVDLGLQRDDDGEDNISAKNSGYCELTAIYWAWKNLDADYYGLFHYRRFYSFADEKFPISDDGRGMVRTKILSPDTFHKYGLDDPTAMRRIIESNDLIIHENRKVYGLPTPIGVPGSTVYEHYKMHDGTIVNTNDIDRMLNVIKQLYPKVYPYIQSYMQGNTFLGYNMFIMRKKYFCDMCDFTFSVLRKMEDYLTPELPNRSINSNRVYGYLAEILTSAYIHYIRQTNPQLKVKHLQMLYVFKTDPIVPLKPIEKSVPIVIDFTGSTLEHSFYLGSTLQQLLNNQQKSHYDIIIAYNDNLLDSVKYCLQKMASTKTSIRFANFADFIDQQQELHGDNIIVNFKLALPYFLPEFNRIIVLNWHTWVKADLNELSNIKLGNHPLAAAQDIMDYNYLRYVDAHQPVSNATKLANLKIDFGHFFNTSVMLLDLAKIRTQITLNKVLTISNDLPNQTNEVIFNSLGLSPLLLDNIWDYQIPTNKAPILAAKGFAPITLSQAWDKIRSGTIDYKIAKFYPDDIINDIDSPFLIEFYQVMQTSQLWPMFVATHHSSNDVSIKQPALGNKLALTKSHCGEFVKKLLPRGSRRRSIVEKTYRRLIRRGN